MTTSKPTPATTSAGTIHVTVLQANGLPTMDYGKQQNPYAIVKFAQDEGKGGRTETITGGGQNPLWSSNDSNEFELQWTGGSTIQLLVEVWNDGNGEDDLIGMGVCDISNLRQSSESKTFTVNLRDFSGKEQRGDLDLAVAFGPSKRKAFRAMERMTNVLDVRDSFVTSLCETQSALGQKAYQLTTTPRNFLLQHKALFLALAAALGVGTVGVIAIAVIIAVPLGFTALITFPLWCIPALLASFATAPLWVPVLGFVVFGILLLGGLFLFLALTSKPIRKQGTKLGNKFKQTELGRRLLYEVPQGVAN